MATDVLERLRAADPAAAMPEPDADERERLRRAIVATPLEPRAARRWPRLRGRTLAVLVAGAVLLGGGAVHAGGYIANAPSQGDVVWEFKTGGMIGGVAAPAATSDGVVYVGSFDSHLYAVDAQSGEETWKVKVGTGHMGGLVYAPAVSDGVVYVAGTYGERRASPLAGWTSSIKPSCLHAVDARSGQEKWNFEIGGLSLSKPAVSDGAVYIGTEDGLHALDARSGQERWKFATVGQGWALAISDGVVYVGSDAGYLYAVDIQSGQERWEFKSGGRILSTPAVSEGVVYIGTDDGYLHALDAQSGQENWKSKTGDKAGSSPVISGGVVYVANYEDYDRGHGWDGYLHALDAQSGQEKWVFRADEALADPDGSPHDGVGHWDGPPAISGGVVYFSSNDGYLHGLDAQGGQEKWKFETGVPEESPLAISGGVVYVGSKDGYVYAVK